MGKWKHIFTNIKESYIGDWESMIGNIKEKEKLIGYKIQESQWIMNQEGIRGYIL